MDWSKEEERQIFDSMDDGPIAIATRAVELAMARGAKRSMLGPMLLKEACREREEARATVATLQAKVEELERDLGHATRKRRASFEMEKELSRAIQARDTLRAEVAELVDERDAARQHKLIAEDELGALRAEVERLKAEASTVRAALKGEVDDRRAAESRLAAIRERASSAIAQDRETENTIRWVLEGDAPQEENKLRAPHTFVAGPDGSSDFCHFSDGDRMRGWERSAHRWPCSPTCTHDDARTPGHPERVKQLSAEVMRMAGGVPDRTCHAPRHINCPCSWDPPQDCRYLSPVAEMESAASSCCERSAEAMRVACLRDVLETLQKLGIADRYVVGQVSAAIEGATP